MIEWRRVVGSPWDSLVAHANAGICTQRSAFWLKANGVIRHAMVHLASGVLPVFTVNEYPKSGGTWVGQLLAAALEVPFPRNRLPGMRSSIMHGHYLWSWNMRNVVVVWRDGRDVITSFYYHSLVPRSDRPNPRGVAIARKGVSFTDYDDIRTNLPEFIEYVFERNRHPAFSWAEFAAAWQGRTDVVHVRYEDLLADCPGQLSRVVRELTGMELDRGRAEEISHRFSFAAQTGRQPGEQDHGSFLRSGVSGDWRNHFTEQARRVFDRYAGDALVALGYESDRSWVGTQTPLLVTHRREEAS